ncbi:hypothetical protein H4696_009750 [Amycolatopsis lexingtonensis]|uniref:Uncharacterized protein n=1 Tax=Amycolatopsis lexingtonensis TaxID=218822 RepID=A0ABR9IHJ3_9PSEU|nr:hypothetical protein [Amycolatopsis lexingtonensis]MBE1502650.1 hypothetical protein [Amycolatopsis lexingtonensis]
MARWSGPRGSTGYGEQFELRWLADEAAAKVRLEVFHGGAESA